MGEQLLAANNIVLGTTNILLIGVPEGWRLLKGYADPEVEYWSEYNGRRWMSKGEAPYRLVEPHPGHSELVGAEVELLVRAARLRSGEPDRRQPGRKPEPQGTVQAGGHEVAYTFGRKRPSLLPWRDVPVLRLDWACPQTGRQLRLELQGFMQGGRRSCAQEHLAALLEPLSAGLCCH